MAQYYEVLSQGDKTSEQQFYNNVEDQTVQYVITPDKTQIQYPTQQIVVTSGDQLMVVDGQQQQIVIDQTSAIAYQGQQIQPQQIQVQVQQQSIQLQQQIQQSQVQQQYAVIQDGLTNGTQQIFYMEGNSNDHIVMDPTNQQTEVSQPIVLNHQLSQNNSIVTNKTVNPAQLQRQVRASLRPPLLQQQQPRPQNRQLPRPMVPNHPLRQQSPGQPQANANQSPLRLPVAGQVRQPNPQLQVRQSAPNQMRPMAATNQPQFRPPNANQPQMRAQNPNQGQVRQQTPNQQQMKLVNPNQQQQARQQRPMGQQLQKNQVIGPRFQGLAQLQQKINTQQQIDLDDMEIKSTDEQEAVSLPDGSVVSIAMYKKMLAEQKRTAALQQRNNQAQANSTNQQGLPTTPANGNNKKRNPTPRTNPRPAPARGSLTRTPVRPRNPANQFPSPTPQQPRPPQPNDPARYAMMNQAQQQGLNKPQTQQQFQGQLQNQMMQQQQQMPRVQPQPQQSRQSQANYVIQPPKPNQKPQQQRPLPSYIPSTQIQKIIENTPVGEEFSDSIRMLVLLENGEQRLITFTLPKEACTIQEILEQVNVPFRNDTDIQVTEANTNGINYIVTVGNVPCFGYEDEEMAIQEETPPQSQPPVLSPQVPLSQTAAEAQQTVACPTPGAQASEPPKAPTPEPPKEVPKYVAGMLALCAGCGYLSEDFAKCIRCGRKLPDNVKAIPATLRSTSGQKKDLQGVREQQSRTIPIKLSPAKKKPSRSSKLVEHESVVISSDEEEEDKPSKVNENILQKLGASITISPVTKEPSANDIQKHSVVKSKAVIPGLEEEPKLVNMAIQCRTVRIGSYRFVPPEKVLVDTNQVVMKVPHPNRENDIKTIKIDRSEIVKVLASFNKSLPVFFYYLNPTLAKSIREELDMTPDGDHYYDPLSAKEEAYRRVTLLPDDIADDDKLHFQLIYGGTPGMLEELNVKEANDILIKTCPKELTKAALGLGSFTEIKQLLTYPPEGRGRLTINTEDYVCLAQDQFLNDVIIDFYLKYLVENLPAEQKQKVHVFSTFFYKRLTTKPTKASRKCQPAELDPTLTPAQKRHARVKTWTKNVNLFEKDFIVVPINENAHWFLAIICFPSMDGCQTWDGKPYKLEVRSRKKKKPVTANAVPATPVKQEKIEKPIICEDPDASDKDEAEGDDSELDSDDSDELPLSQSSVSSTTTSASSAPATPTSTAAPAVRQPKEPRPPIKQPCILIFDSLAGASRSRVVATLRDYLTCEYKVKLNKEKIYNKDVIKGASPKVPQQNNFTDCGLYLLQYVEQFFKDPIKDYHIPISQIKNWFDEIIVTKKREDIANLIKDLMRKCGKDVSMLPDIAFPTINGKIVEREPEEEEEDEMMEDEDFHTEEDQETKDESSAAADTSGAESLLDNSTAEDSKEESGCSPIKPSNDGVPSDFVSQTVLNPKPDISEFPRQTNRDTLSYLKAKRIIRHKNTDGPDMKKTKSDHTQ